MTDSTNDFNKWDDLRSSFIPYLLITCSVILILNLIYPVIVNFEIIRKIISNIDDFSLLAGNEIKSNRIIVWSSFGILICFDLCRRIKSKLYTISHLDWIFLIVFLDLYMIEKIEFSKMGVIPWPIFYFFNVTVSALYNFSIYSNLKFNSSYFLLDIPSELGQDSTKLDNRSILARKLSDIIIQFRGKTSLAIAVQGEFGVGKSTYIGIIKKEIENKRKENSHSKNYIFPHIIEINFWTFKNPDEIIKYILLNISQIIDNKDSKSIFQEYKNLLTHDLKYNSLKKLFSPNLFHSETDMMKIKKEIRKKMTRSNKNILIIFEDVDRGGNENAVEVFKIIRTIVDFPGIIFIAAFDKENIASLPIFQEGRMNIDKYFMKIFQIQVNVPNSDTHWNEDEFSKRFKTQYEIVKKEYSISIIDEEKIDDLIPLLKEIVVDISQFNQFTNDLLTKLIFLESEISFTNLFCLELLRVSNRGYYDMIALDFSLTLIEHRENLKSRLNPIGFTILDKLVSEYSTHDFIYNYTGHKKYFDYYFYFNTFKSLNYNALKYPFVVVLVAI